MASTISLQNNSILSSEPYIVEVGVGHNLSIYYVHKDTLLKSRFFSAFLNHNYTEAANKKISLPEDDPDAVMLYITGLYTGSVDYDENTRLVNTFELADKVCEEAYHNELMDSLRAHYAEMGYAMDCSDLVALFQKGLGESEVAKFGIINNAHVLLTKTESWDQQTDFWNMLETEPQQLNELVRALMKETIAQKKPRGRIEDPRKVKGCHFHMHAVGSVCPKAITIDPRELRRSTQQLASDYDM